MYPLRKLGFNVVKNTLHDFMHMFYGVVLLIFQYILRMNFGDNRKKIFFTQDRRIPPDVAHRQQKFMGWQTSNDRIKQCQQFHSLRRVPTSQDGGKLDQPFGITKDNHSTTLLVDSSASYIHMAGPIGVYYVYYFLNEIEYKKAFAGLLWWIYKLRRRHANKDILTKSTNREYDPQTQSHKSVKNLVRVGYEVCGMLEAIMPVHFCTFVFHEICHACEVIAYTGPVYATWMFVYER